MLHLCKLLLLAACGVEAMRPSTGKAPKCSRRQSFAAAAATLLVPTAATAATAEQVERFKVDGFLVVPNVLDASGLAASADFSRSGAFDRAVNAFGASSILDELLETGDTAQANLHKMLNLRKAKQAATRFGAALYERAVVLDADTYACDARALEAVAAALEDADVVVVSRARTPNCLKPISKALGASKDDLVPEYNTGVLGLSRASLPLLERWDHWHARLACNGQDQPAFRAALTEAVKRGLRRKPKRGPVWIIMLAVAAAFVLCLLAGSTGESEPAVFAVKCSVDQCLAVFGRLDSCLSYTGYVYTYAYLTKTALKTPAG